MAKSHYRFNAIKTYHKNAILVKSKMSSSPYTPNA